MDELSPCRRAQLCTAFIASSVDTSASRMDLLQRVLSSLAPSASIGTMGRQSPAHGRSRFGSTSSRQLTSKSRSPLKRRPHAGTPRFVLTPCPRYSKGVPRTGTPGSQGQRAPSPCRVKSESPRDPEKRRRAWLDGAPLASPAPPPFGEVVSGEFSPSHEADLTTAAPARRRHPPPGQFCLFRCVGTYYLMRWEEASEGRLLCLRWLWPCRGWSKIY